ncbi:uncharacterized protein LY89DRAFT_679441 [Mollisia scopiformis]|uniref:Uncharacterized protein n=1 Tax=Mollisia scopiformis TaxID=149040 RepID=A0A194XW71_MOLSC|nr:uncharacterized protein LY89DRAFT_679441 [Mollisia scopiformis]KUJ24264.1 hypothetical protein LY89DRAFT_679441 [Mollisia scopiformis]
MDNADGAIRTRLGTCKPWKDELQELYQNDKRLEPTYYIITGVYTCKNMRVGWAKQKMNGGGVAVGVPGQAIAAAAGAPIPNSAAKLLDMTAKYDNVKQTDTEISARIPQEIIFAFRYHILELAFEEQPAQKQPNILTKAYHKFIGRSGSTRVSAHKIIKSVSLGPPVRGPGAITAYGSDED